VQSTAVTVQRKLKFRKRKRKETCLQFRFKCWQCCQWRDLSTSCQKVCCVVVMKPGKLHDTTDTTEFCPHQLVTDLLWGKWCNGFWENLLRGSCQLTSCGLATRKVANLL